MEKKEPFWSPLDNAAKIFPAICSKEQSSVIRLSVSLTEPIAIGSLAKAIKRAETRFHFFKVRLRRGFFWYYLEKVDDPVVAQLDDGIACRKFDKKGKDKLLLRILVYRNQLNIEFSHILSDGYGLVTFLKGILYYYFLDKGIIDETQVEPFFLTDAHGEEYEDAYSRYFKENIPFVIKQPKAYHLPFPLKKKPRFDLLYGILSISEIKKCAQEKRVSITDYLVAVYLCVIQDIFLECRKKGRYSFSKIARIQVPVNLRNIYPTKTMRNFSLFVMPEIDFRLGTYTFDEILKIVYHKMQLETDEKLISKIISRNVGSERNILVRGIPLWIKSLILYYKYYSEGTNQYSGVVTNLGKIDFPDSISQRIEFMALTPPPPNKKLRVNCGVIGFGNSLVLSFGNISNSRDFERRFFHFLTQQGIHVKIKTGGLK